jgi:abortive infection bacteriophage resistance protein
LQYNKPATTVEQQVANLCARGLVCPDAGRAIRHMRAIGYYRLSAYWLPFEDPAPQGQTRSKRFSNGTSWDDVVELYSFDRKLRLLVMDSIDRVEVAARASWTNRLTLAHGSHAHLNSELFINPFEHARMIAQMAATVEKSKEVFVEHYRRKYTSPYMPALWSVCETMSLGQLSLWFSNTKNNAVRNQVARDLGLPTRETAEGVLHSLSYVRNICAHHGRLWNRRFVKRLPIIKRLGSEMIKEGSQGQPQNLIYNTLVVLLYIMRAQGGGSDFLTSLIGLLTTTSHQRHAMMGFPADWQTRPSWQA